MQEYNLSEILEQVHLQPQSSDEEEYEEENEEDGDNRENQGGEDFQKLLSTIMGGIGGEGLSGGGPDGGGPGAGIQSMLESLFNGIQEERETFEFIFGDDSVSELYSNTGSSNEDSGIDLFMPETVVINANATALVDLKVTAVLRHINKKTGAFWLLPRSSIYKTPLRLANSVGLIDAGYRNTLKVAVDNRSSDAYIIEKGTRLFQLAAPSLTPLQWVKKAALDETDETERGLGGFGSTGV